MREHNDYVTYADETNAALYDNYATTADSKTVPEEIISRLNTLTAQLERFADPNNYYVGNDSGDPMYDGNPIKEAQAALNGECPLCSKPLNGELLFHQACADEETAREESAKAALVKVFRFNRSIFG